MIVPKIVYPSGGANVLYLDLPSRRLSAFRRKALRHDTFSSSGIKQSILERVDEFLRLRLEIISAAGNLAKQSEQLEDAAWIKDSNLVVGKNYLKPSEKFEHADWVKSGTPSAPTVTANQDAAPDGSVTADQIDFPATGGGQSNRISQDAGPAMPGYQNQSVLFPIFLRAASDTTVRIYIDDGVSIVSKDVVATSTWQRFVTPKGVEASATKVEAGIEQTAGQAAKTIFAFGAQLEFGGSLTEETPSDYTKTVASATELLIADPFWPAPASGEAGASLGFSKFPKRGRQLVNFAASGEQKIWQNVAIEPRGRVFTGSIYVKEQDPTPPGGDLFVVGSTEFATVAFTPGASWKREFVTAAFLPGNQGSQTQLRTDVNAPGTFYVFGADLKRGNALEQYLRTGTAAPPTAAWDEFMQEALKGTEFDYFPDADGSAFTTYTLEDTDWEEKFMFRDNFKFEILCRRVQT